MPGGLVIILGNRKISSSRNNMGKLMRRNNRNKQTK